jgi:hypothetical protein
VVEGAWSVVATGGDAGWIISGIGGLSIQVDPDLTLHGLRLVAQQNTSTVHPG